MPLQAEANLLALIESTEDLIWSVDLDYRLITFNRALQRHIQSVFGVQPAAGMLPKDLVSPGREGFMPPLYERALAEGSFKEEFSLADGRTLELALNPIVVGGKMTGVSVFGKDITKRKAAEESIRFLAKVVENCEEAIITNAPSGAILTWNHGAEAIYGYSADEAIGRPLSMIIAPERRERADLAIGQLLAGAPLMQDDGLALRKGGKKVHVTVASWPIRNSAGEVKAICTIVRDVSVRHEAEETRALLASIVNSSTDAIHAVNLDGTVIGWNHGAEALFGYTSEEIIGKSVAMLAPPGRGQEVAFFMGVVAKGDIVAPFDTLLCSKDGVEIEVSLSISPMRNPDGEVVGAGAIARDIRQRKLAERALQQAEKKYRDIFEGALEGMCQVSPEGKFLTANLAMSRMLGYDSAEELISLAGDLANDVWADPDEREKYLRKLEEQGYAWGYECQFKRRDGTLIWASLNDRRVCGADGSLLYLEGFMEDITEQKRAEGALLESLESLKEAQIIGCIGSYVLDFPSGIWTSSDVLDGLFGIGQEYNRTVTGWTALIHPDDRAMMAAYLAEEVVGKGQNFNKEYRIVRQTDHAVRWLHGAGRLEFDAQGQPLKMRGVIKDITDSKLSEMQLRDSEERYRATFEQAPVGIIHVSFEGTILRCNARFAQIIGYPADEVPGLTVHQITAPGDIVIGIESKERISSGTGAETIEKRYIRKDGSLVWVRTSVAIQRDGEGRPLHFCAFVEDVNARKEAEELLAQASQALQVSEERYRTVFETCPDAVMITRMSDGVILDVNQASLDSAGFVRDEVIGRTATELGAWVNDRDKQTFVDTLLRDSRCRDMEVESRKKNGENFWMRLSASLIEIGGCQCGLTFAHDISDAKAAAEALRLSEERYRLAFQLNFDSIDICDKENGRFIDVNEAFLKNLGYKREEVIGRTSLELGLWDNPVDRQRLMEEIRENSVCRSFETRYRISNGSLRWGLLSVSTIEMNGVPCVLSVTRDITEAKLAEERLASAAEALRLSEERYRIVFQTSLDGISIARLSDMRFIDVNQALLDNLGYEREEVIGKTSAELGFFADDRDRDAMLEAVRQNSGCLALEAQFRKKNQEIVWGELTASIIEIEGVLCILSIARDITAAKAAEERLAAAAEALRLSEERYRTAFQTSIDSIVINRLSDGSYIDCNQAFLNILGYEREEVIGRTSLELGIWADISDRQAMVEMVRQNSSCRGFEAQFRKKNGEIMWGQMFASIVEIDSVPCILSTVRDLSSAKAAEKTIRNLAFYDPLTGLPNRRQLLERLRELPAADVPKGRSIALLLVDLDNFKIFNDTLGHQKGDLLLMDVARRAAGAVHEGDTVCRLGGDEFVVMLEDLSEIAEEAAAQAKAVGEHILAALGRPYSIENREYHLTASIGITIFGDRQESTGDVLQQADIAMDQSKAAGGNTMRFFSPALQAAVNDRAALEVELRHAIRTNQFQLYYQAQVECGTITGVEALIRWNHPARGLVMPDDFISIAEESRLILPIGNWVLETACAQVAAWADRKLTSSLSIAVNISALQFRQPEFVEEVLSALSTTGANPRNLRLELTESMLVEDIDDVIAKMTELRSHGLRFSLDDFGTGYSSLAYLKRLSLDRLKIDRSFVRDILADSTSGAIAQTILSLGKAMGLSVIAEGVETEEQRVFLADLGCHSFQGYLFSRPIPLKQFELLLDLEAKPLRQC
jgi:diguanylate cyclase (GGDEF)-like protein/PAS domain S-box-containing protein